MFSTRGVDGGDRVRGVVRGITPFLVGLGSGIAAAFFLDRDRGRQRRALIRDKTASLGRSTKRAFGVIGRDVRQRAHGIGSRARKVLSRAPVSDEVLTERIRSELGRRVSHPHAILVHVLDGHVTLAGPVLSREVRRLVRRVKRCRGVRGLDNRLEVHTTADSVPGLQGAGVVPRQRRNPLLDSWPPAARFLAGTAGAAAWLRGAPRRTPRSLLASGFGALLFARALMNAPVRSRRSRPSQPAGHRENEGEEPPVHRFGGSRERADLAELDT